jgi:endonuclease/exonuclease/phosphatase family metal-dependent hydrolase
MMRLLSFNIRGASFPDGSDAWPLRRDALLACLDRHNADIIGLQEAELDNLIAITRHLPDHHGIAGWAYNRPGRTFYCAWYLRHGWPVHAQGSQYLGDIPAHWHRDSDAARVHVFNWLIVGNATAPLLLCNTHLDHLGAQARRRGAAQIAAFCRRHASPALVLGDFNQAPGGDGPWEAFQAGGLHNASRQDLGPTCHSFANEQANPANQQRLDGFVTRDLEVHADLVDRNRYLGRYPSDHYPVRLDIAITR